MVEHYRDNQYEDDLTVGADDYEDDFQIDDIDLFAFQDEEDSPIAQLKQLVLSIDWEINDEVLSLFEEELVALKDVWADDKTRLVYLQALEKIGRYINRYKSDAHPASIKLLFSMYQNLEKIVLSDDLTDDDITRLLKSDIAKFENLKELVVVAKSMGGRAAAPGTGAGLAQDREEAVHELVELKAIILGIDWEITEEDLLKLHQEVQRLEILFAQSPVRLIFLQGIGLLGKFIRKQGHDVYSDVFGLVGSFYQGLEKIVETPMSFEEEKAVLLQEVEKFNAFKMLIMERIAKSGNRKDKDADTKNTEVVPALADLSESDDDYPEEVDFSVSGSTDTVEQHVDQFFDEESDVTVTEQPDNEQFAEGSQEDIEAFSDAFFGTTEEVAAVSVDEETALQGLNVETEADEESEEEAALVGDDEEALAFIGEETRSAFSEDELENTPPEEQLSDEVVGRIDSFFTDTPMNVEDKESEEDFFTVPADVALQGVDVESEDTEEETFAEDEDIVAALSVEEPEEESSLNEDVIQREESEEDVTPDSLFAELGESLASSAESTEDRFTAVTTDGVLQGDEEGGEEGDEVLDLFDFEEDFEEEGLSDVDGSEEEQTKGDVQADVYEGLLTESVLDDEDEAPALLDFEDSIDEALTPEMDEQQSSSEQDILVGAASLGTAALAATSESQSQENIDDDKDVVPFDLVEALNEAVQTLALDQDNSVISGLFAQLDSLRHLWKEMPLHSSYLDLISVVVEHVERYRYERSSDTLGVLLNLVANIKEHCDADSTSKQLQESLKEDMCTVLSWQQDLVHSYAAGDVGLIATVAEMGNTQEASPADFMAELDNVDAVVADEPGDIGLEGLLDQELESQQFVIPGEDEEQVTMILRQEIVALRESLQQEIAELRDVLKKD